MIHMRTKHLTHLTHQIPTLVSPRPTFLYFEDTFHKEIIKICSVAGHIDIYWIYFFWRQPILWRGGGSGNLFSVCKHSFPSEWSAAPVLLSHWSELGSRTGCDWSVESSQNRLQTLWACLYTVVVGAELARESVLEPPLTDYPYTR